MPDVIVNSTVKKQGEEIKEHINTLINETNTNLGKKSDTASAASASSMFSWIKNINTYTSRGAVKSVQRGTSLPTTSGNYTITISSVTPSKCDVSYDGARTWLASSPYTATALPYTVSLSSTSLTVGNGGGSAGNYATFAWQIVEYY